MWPAGDRRFTQRFLTLRSGERVRVVECGPADSARPTIVLFPGWGSPAYVFRDLMCELAVHGYRSVAPEPRGQGLSDKPASRHAYTTEALSEHIAGVLSALELRSFVLGGHSLGAAHAARAALKHPDGLRGLILMSPVGTHGQPRRLLVALLPVRLARPVARWLARRWVVRLILWMAAARPRVYTRRDVDEYWAPTQFPGVARSSLDLLTELDWGEERPLYASDIGVPTLVIYGARDPLVARTSAAAQLAQSPLVRVRELAGVGHIITDEAPRETARAVIEFLDRL
jgi:pimeloyl-ACP methyl ester carboxylesterase